MREFMDGAEAIVRGALKAGCNFFAGYPITPATPIMLKMLRELSKVGGIGIQGEDEIASIGMCIGAAMTGMKTLTATSGPGISLYSENIGMAIMGEVPLVIVDVMRLGPATGGATTVSQGDVQFLRWVTSGGFPIIALAPSSLADCYTLTQRAFNLAEKFRTPVFIATDKEMVIAQQSVETDAFEDLEIVNRAPTAEGNFIPYHAKKLADVPAFAPVGGAQITRLTTSMHDEHGMLTKKPSNVNKTSRHLYQKIEAHRDELEFVQLDAQEGAQTLVVAYGISARSAIEAVRLARAAGKRVAMLTIQSLWPLPEQSLRAALRGNVAAPAEPGEESRSFVSRVGPPSITRVIVPELNFGQYRLEIERVALLFDSRLEVIGVNRVDGELIEPEEISQLVN
ncbi:MAG: pyruvate flavodoxin/ferredoxin oxidoreductase [Chloroflexi bacterium]|nr:pyruvate flavodoxin/ferredoxin oxidoreductase [Chloroflexota bacterium]